MSTDLHAELAARGRQQRAERRPVEMAEILAALDSSPALLDASIDGAVPSVEAEADGARGDVLMFDDRWRVNDNGAPSARKRWIGVLTAVAATILVVVGIVAVAQRDSPDVSNDVPVGPSVAEPLPPLEEPDPPPSVVDALGYRWSRVPHDVAVFGGKGGQVMNGVAVGGPGLVAVGSSGSDDDGDAAVWTSQDGITWSRVPHDEAVFGGSGSQRMLSVVAGGPGLVAVGHDGSVAGADLVAAVWTSADGLTWSRVPHDEATFGGDVDQGLMSSVTVGGPGLVAVGSFGSNHDRGPAAGDAAVWTSVDGITWSRVVHNEAVFGGSGFLWMTSVVAAGPGLVAVGEDWSGEWSGHTDDDHAAVWTSDDGVNWSRLPHDEAVFGGGGFQGMSSVVAGGPGLVAVGYDQPGDDVPEGPSSRAAAWTSVDGVVWSRLPHDETIFGGTGFQGMFSVIATGRGLVAVGIDGGGYGTRADASLWTSVDGITWSRLPHDETIFGGTAMSGVVAAGPGLVAVGAEEPGDGENVDAVVWVATPPP